MVTHRQLEEAQGYFHYAVKLGYFDPDDFSDMNDDEFVAAMHEFMDRGDVYSDVLQEEGNTDYGTCTK